MIFGKHHVSLPKELSSNYIPTPPQSTWRRVNKHVCGVFFSFQTCVLLYTSRATRTRLKSDRQYFPVSNRHRLR